MTPKRNVFLGKKFAADPTIKKSPLSKNFTQLGYHLVVTHVLYHFCDMSLITACTMHMYTFFGNTPFSSWLKIKIVTRFTYRIDIWLLTLLLSLQYLSESCMLWINFYYPTLELFCFSFTHCNLFPTQSFVYPAPFSPAINDRSLGPYLHHISVLFEPLLLYLPTLGRVGSFYGN